MLFDLLSDPHRRATSSPKPELGLVKAELYAELESSRPGGKAPCPRPRARRGSMGLFFLLINYLVPWDVAEETGPLGGAGGASSATGDHTPTKGIKGMRHESHSMRGTHRA
jgi:hypothetical protein